MGRRFRRTRNASMRTTRQSVQSSRAVLIISTGTRTNYLLPMVAAVHVGVLLQTNTVCRILVQQPGSTKYQRPPLKLVCAAQGR